MDAGSPQPPTNPNIDPVEPTPDAPKLDTAAIDEAVAATANATPNIQGAVDVNDISLADTPTSDAELQQQAEQAATDPATPNFDTPASEPAPADAGAPATDGGEAPAEPSASFVDGDLKDANAGEAEEAPVVAQNVLTAAPRRSSKGALIAIVVILLLVAAGAAAYFLFLK